MPSAAVPTSGGCQCALEVNETGERATLVVLLVLNLLLLVVEGTLGIKASSTALIADALDNLADAAVYGVGLYVVGRPARLKVHAARVSGVLQALLALVVLGDIIRRVQDDDNEPESWFMIAVGLGALVVNLVCLVLISRYRTGGVHMKASYIFSQNDVIANTATVLSGIIIMYTEQEWLDLVVGGCIALVVLCGAIRILRQAKIAEQEQQQQDDTSTTGQQVCDDDGSPCTKCATQAACTQAGHSASMQSCV
eukprot:m.163440 g.163440  ORF g.163440 m.163440 type:complete len:253 (+) comp17690_c0_seq8:552-1310(+)